MSKTLTFIDNCLHGTFGPDQIDDYVAQWHDGAIGNGLELRELLGMSRSEYAMWLQDAKAIHKIITARREAYSDAAAGIQRR
jgi:hypothetical protein